MLIVCPSCGTSYDVKSANMPPTGRQVRCLRCRTVWHAEPSRADKVLAAAEAIGPDRDVSAEVSGLAAEQMASQAASELLESPADDALQTVGAELFAPATARGIDADDASGESSDAEEVDAPSIAPDDFEDRLPIDVEVDQHGGQRPAPREDIEAVAARRQIRSKARSVPRWPLSPLQSGILALVLIDAILIGWRQDVVRALPQTASLYALLGMPVNLRGLIFDGVVSATEQHDGVPILVVEGNVVNTARKVVEIPRLKFIVRNAARQEIYSWIAVASRPSVAPGEALGFRTRLASPPPDARDVIVRFVNRRDIVAGAR